MVGRGGSGKPPRSIRRKEPTMRITAMALAGLVAGALVTAGAAQAEVPAQGGLYPLRPSLSLSPQSEADDIRREIADLDASWGSLSPGDRNQRLNTIQN